MASKVATPSGQNTQSTANMYRSTQIANDHVPRCDLGIIHIEDAKAGHVDTTEAIRLEVNGHQVL